jgi:hypothetical protein
MMRKRLSILLVTVFLLIPVSVFPEDPDGEMGQKAVDLILGEIEALNPDNDEGPSTKGVRSPDKIVRAPKGTSSETGSLSPSTKKGGAHQAGISGNLSHELNESFSLGMEFAHLPDFDLNESRNGSQDRQSAVDVNTYMPAIKFTPDFGFKGITPYFVGGLGVLSTHRSRDDGGLSKWLPGLDDESGMGLSGRIGGGMDIRRGKTSFEIQGNYASGVGEMADVVYESMSAGVTFHW